MTIIDVGYAKAGDNADITSLGGLTTPIPLGGGGTNAATAIAARVALGIGAPDVILEDQKSASTAPGTFTSGANRTRDLNTEVRDVNSYCSLASNQFTLVAGTWYIEWSAPAFMVDQNQSLLYDVTGAAELKRGTPEYSGSAAAYTVSWSNGSHVFTNAGSNAYEIRHVCTTTKATEGFGLSGNFATEIYTVVKLWKTA